MKVLLIVALCFVGALTFTDEDRAKLSEYKEACIIESGVNVDFVEHLKKDDADWSDEKLSCYVSCMFKKVEIINESGALDEDKVREKASSEISKEQIDKVLDNCRDTSGENDCDKAIKLVKCFKDNGVVV